MGTDRNAFMMVTAVGRKANGHYSYSSDTGRGVVQSGTWRSHVCGLKQKRELGYCYYRSSISITGGKIWRYCDDTPVSLKHELCIRFLK